MSTSLLLIFINRMTESSVKSSTRTQILLSLVVILVTIIGLLCRQILRLRCWRVTKDSTHDQCHDEQPLHDISEQQKRRILAEAECKQTAFKLRQELLAGNKALKTQVYQQKEEFSKLSDDKRKYDEFMKQMNDKVTKMNEKTMS